MGSPLTGTPFSDPDRQGGAGQVRNRPPGTVAQSRPGVPRRPCEVPPVCRMLVPAYDSQLFPKKPIVLVKSLFALFSLLGEHKDDAGTRDRDLFKEQREPHGLATSRRACTWEPSLVVGQFV